MRIISYDNLHDLPYENTIIEVNDRFIYGICMDKNVVLGAYKSIEQAQKIMKELIETYEKRTYCYGNWNSKEDSRVFKFPSLDEMVLQEVEDKLMDIGINVRNENGEYKNTNDVLIELSKVKDNTDDIKHLLAY